jgi:hypothetical protein
MSQGGIVPASGPAETGLLKTLQQNNRSTDCGARGETMARIDGVTAASRRTQRARELAEAIEQRRESIYDDQRPPQQERWLIMASIWILLLGIVLVAGVAR